METDLRINDTHAYHALAIDEHREAFKPTLWTRIGDQSPASVAIRDFPHVEQRWFVGAHSNVGGGYANDLLAQAPLQWIKKRAEDHGLLFTDTVDLDDGSVQCPVRDSLAEMAHGIYEIMTFGKHYFRPIGAMPETTTLGVRSTINESIDQSVFTRWRGDLSYRPNNLMEWAGRHSLDLATLERSVNAHDPANPLSD